MSNPWKLTLREMEVLNALIEHGSAKKAMVSLNIRTSTFNTHLKGAKAKMNKSRLHTILGWYAHTLHMKGINV